MVCYANEVKINTLGVSFQDIQQYGAVSETVARQMAEGARKQLNTDFAIATTGVAVLMVAATKNLLVPCGLQLLMPRELLLKDAFSLLLAKTLLIAPQIMQF